MINPDNSEHNDTAAGNSASTVKTLRKALSILDIVASADTALTVAEIALKSGLSRPTAHRLVQTLVAEGHLMQEPYDSRVSIGFSVLQLASSMLDRNRLRLEALPHLQALAIRSGERANLGILHKNAVLYLAGVEKPSLPTIYSRFGKTAPVHCSSLGKAILAFMPDNEARSIIGSAALLPQTSHSITDMAQLFAQFAEIRAAGYAVDLQEHMYGSFCIAAPIIDKRNCVIGAIGLSGRAIDPLIEEAPHLRHTAELIAHVL